MKERHPSKRAGAGPHGAAWLLALAPALLGLAPLGCGGANLASALVRAPEFKPAGQTKCSVKASQTHPLIVEWPAADRGALEAQKNEGTVVVRYTGCEMELLRQCRAPGSYRYAPVTIKEDHLAIRDADELYAAMPLFAAKLEGKLESAGQLTVDMSIVGSFEAEQPRVKLAELQGDCSRATHVVAAITAGAFELGAGASATVGAGAEGLGAAAGAESHAERETLNRDGDRDACRQATASDERPPQGCGALLRVEVVSLARAEGTWASNDPAAPPPGWGPSPYVGSAAPDLPARQVSARQKRLGTTSLVMGSILLATGIGTGVGALVLDGDLDAACGDAPCHPENAGVVRSYDWLATVSTVGFISGGVIGGAGGLLLLTAPAGRQSPADDTAPEPKTGVELLPLLAPGGVGLRGRF